MEYAPEEAARYINSLITRKAKIQAFNHFRELRGEAYANKVRSRLRKDKAPKPRGQEK